MQATTTAGALYTAETLRGRNVLSTNGESLGEIDNIVIDSSRGCIAYAVLSMRAGMFGGKQKLFAVPWKALTIDEAHKDFVLGIDRDTLANSPGFDRDQWPSEPDPTFARSINDYYGYDENYNFRGRSGAEQGRGGSEGYGSSEGYVTDERRGSSEGYGSDQQRGTGEGYGSATPGRGDYDRDRDKGGGF